MYCLEWTRTIGFVELTCVLFITPGPGLTSEGTVEVTQVTREYSPVQLILKLGETSLVQNPAVGFFQPFKLVNVGGGYCV